MNARLAVVLVGFAFLVGQVRPEAQAPVRMRPPFYLISFAFTAGPDLLGQKVKDWSFCVQGRCALFTAATQQCPADAACEVIRVSESELSGRQPNKRGYVYKFEHQFPSDLPHEPIAKSKRYLDESRDAALGVMLEWLKKALVCHDQTTPHRSEIALAPLPQLPADCVCAP